MDISDLINISEGAIRSSTPILYAVLGEMITEKSGVINLGIEGIMLAGALSGVIMNYYSGSAFLCIIFAFVIGCVFGALHGIGTTIFKANQIAFGLAITIFCTGLTSYLGEGFVEAQIQTIPTFHVPVLSQIPFLGTVLFEQDLLVYLVILSAFAIYYIFKKTHLGLKIIAVGENPEASYKLGLNVKLLRILATTIGGGFMAIGGAYLALVFAQGWVENMTLGRGFIAAGLVIFAMWKPLRSIYAVLIFGVPIAFQLELQSNGTNISPFVLSMFPYIAVILALIIASSKSFRNRSEMPRSLGKN